MKEKVIATAGKTWKALGQKGEATAVQIAKIVNENEDVVNQAIGWLAREDKINYIKKNSKNLVSLVDSENDAYQRLYAKAKSKPKTVAKKTPVKRKKK